MAEMTEEEKRIVWERGQRALQRIMRYVKVEKIEALADKIDQKDFREGFAFKQFLKSL